MPRKIQSRTKSIREKTITPKHVKIEIRKSKSVDVKDSTKDALNVKCQSCGSVTIIPFVRFYDGYEGVFSCNSCQEPLDHLMDSLEE